MGGRASTSSVHSPAGAGIEKSSTVGLGGTPARDMARRRVEPAFAAKHVAVVVAENAKPAAQSAILSKIPSSLGGLKAITRLITGIARSDTETLDRCSREFVEMLNRNPALYLAILRSMHLVARSSRDSSYREVLEKALRATLSVNDYVRITARATGDEGEETIHYYLRRGLLLVLYSSSYTNPLEIRGYGSKLLESLLSGPDNRVETLEASIIAKRAVSELNCPITNRV